ncbi:protein of unknown function [Cupriavidus taiwanensis]|uniref:Uncharacterized protein n=1 Tax=Cupriavidus taiwanensis TaxID=164546 RepID=A0A7Z7J9B1_9BURK|nr:protein of unknown function [Cupriavidus taiwanensis]SOZ06227.1 hypothetical protein CBM2595_A80912 [Cupriavidus taiwanensis]SPC18757.1 hypothetical protein CBM2594_A80196 [Cupriavidus taiwanensis]SPD41108.1 protein of unknown function [Cupriavidus taiwanensis]
MQFSRREGCGQHQWQHYAARGVRRMRGLSESFELRWPEWWPC